MLVGFKTKLILLTGFLIVFVAVLLFIPPIPQSEAYHNFADHRFWLGVPNFGDVVSNAGFIVVGILGLSSIFKTDLFDNNADRLPYTVFFAAVTLIGFGSAYYHWAPANETLFWDRLPITIAFMSLFAAVIADRIDRRAGIYWLLPILVAAGIISLVYWQQTEAVGTGDLRFYGMVQYFPVAAILFIIWQVKEYKYTSGTPLIQVFVWYAASKLFEYFDKQIFELLSGAVSGHTLKHLAAAVAAYMILTMLRMSAIERR